MHPFLGLLFGGIIGIIGKYRRAIGKYRRGIGKYRREIGGNRMKIGKLAPFLGSTE